MTVDQAPQDTGGEKRRFSLPSAYTILFLLIILAAIATWLVPAGTYDLDEAGSPVPGTYHEIESKPQKIIGTIKDTAQDAFAGFGSDTYAKRQALIVENAQHFVRGEPLRYVIDKALRY